MILCAMFLLMVVSGCDKKEEAAKAGGATDVSQPSDPIPESFNPPEAIITTLDPEPQPEAPRDAVVGVDGAILKKADLDKKLKAKMKLYGDMIPAEKKKEAREKLRKQLIEEFIMRTVLQNEVNSRKIMVTEKEIQGELNRMRAKLPADKKLEELLKENEISKDDISLELRIRKLVKMDMGKNTKPSSQEIIKFYEDHQGEFKTPETAHVRHILVTIHADDDEKTKTEKKEKIEGLRKQILDGADFADVAKNNSKCPSRDKGGDLGEIRKGQTVKPFEEAAFSQEENAVGPVVTTEYGYHIIQVLKRNPGKVVALDEVKDQIARYLEELKQREVFSKLAARLRKNAVIVDYEKNRK